MMKGVGRGYEEKELQLCCNVAKPDLAGDGVLLHGGK
jgi:hypothetical protein